MPQDYHNVLNRRASAQQSARHAVAENVDAGVHRSRQRYALGFIVQTLLLRDLSRSKSDKRVLFGFKLHL